MAAYFLVYHVLALVVVTNHQLDFLASAEYAVFIQELGFEILYLLGMVSYCLVERSDILLVKEFILLLDPFSLLDTVFELLTDLLDEMNE